MYQNYELIISTIFMDSRSSLRYLILIIYGNFIYDIATYVTSKMDEKTDKSNLKINQNVNKKHSLKLVVVVDDDFY